MVNKLLLVNPYIIDIAAYDFWNKPIGLLYIASIFKKNGYQLEFIDLLDRFNAPEKKIRNKWGNTGKYNTEKIESLIIGSKVYKLKRYGLPLERFKEKLDSIQNIDMIFLTSHITYWYKGVLQTAKILKEKFPNVPIILGGNGAILDSSQYANSNYFSKIFTTSDLQDLYNYFEGYFNKKLRFKPVKREDYPLPLWELYEKKVTASIQTSWGCPYHCTYCASNKIYPFFYQRQIDDIIAELQHLVSLGFKDIAFYDDAILVNANEHIIPLLNQWATLPENGRVAFHLPNAIHPQFLTKRIAELFKKTNFQTIAIGHDTKSVRQKQQKEYPIERSISLLIKQGFKSRNIWIYLLTGLPYQSKREIYEEMEIINKLNATIKLAWFSPIPGTLDYKNLNEKYKDPFYYNNSLYVLVSRIFTHNEMQNIKQYEKELNRRLYD